MKSTFKRIGIRLKKCWKKAIVGLMTVVFPFMASTSVMADGKIENSDIVQGTKNLISDVTNWLMVLAPVVAGLLIIYFCIRRSAADEMDQKKWNNRIVVAVVSCIGAVLGSATLQLILSYFKAESV